MATNMDSWNCPHCLKLFKKSYRYKNHLSRCLVYTEHLDTKNEFLGDMINDLKTELLRDFKKDFYKMLSEIKNEMINNNKIKPLIIYK
jgi:hypothetical protein